MSWGTGVREDFLGYYERELSYLRHLGAEFGKRYPMLASRLRPDPAQGDDPHVDHRLDAFAFRAAWRGKGGAAFGGDVSKLGPADVRSRRTVRLAELAIQESGGR